MEEVETKEEVSAEQKKPRGRPKKPTKPNWRPASNLATLKAKKGFTAYWASSDPANIARKKAEGWIVMKPEDNVGPPIEQIDVNDGTALHDGIRYRDHIAMMLPDELKEAREDYHQEENRNQMAGVLRETDEKTQQMGVQTYKPQGQAGRVVIE